MFYVGDSEVCLCGTSPMTAEHFLQTCPIHQNLRANIWPTDLPKRGKLFGPLEGLQHTAAFIRASGIDV